MRPEDATHKASMSAFRILLRRRTLPFGRFVFDERLSHAPTKRAKSNDDRKSDCK
jgi:hypothetical protein